MKLNQLIAATAVMSAVSTAQAMTPSQMDAFCGGTFFYSASINPRGSDVFNAYVTFGARFLERAAKGMGAPAADAYAAQVGRQNSSRLDTGLTQEIQACIDRGRLTGIMPR